ncbi:MBOAT family O-acyltransferase [Rhodocyclus purpureus]|uniref:MBOAT family O-acyltransferase n=1 Tax=Rhodocyclus purpureus TaxID=1067 RepID=UPI001911303B|nr:MBOAT family protein [Rhodocyclus purpureus]MBK5913833.1 membrane-bound O-acyltransferase family protein [Rhodocyclus purpureus]
MLFTSAIFFCVYLPIVLVGYYLLGRRDAMWGAIWLFLASLAFYGYWMPEFTTLLLGSIIWNFWIGKKIGGARQVGGVPAKTVAARNWFTLGVAVDLGLLAYFKYAGWFVANLNALTGQDWSTGRIILPIGISFFTFTQIAFLSDAYLKGTREVRFAHFGLFVTYFPHLIAGPVIHHAQMMPQFRDAASYRFVPGHVAAGLFIFAIGLFKKVVLADAISPYADAVFDAAQAGERPDLAEAWIGALAYTFQLYFDFSGYSDMAIGLSWMLNIRLPFNFDSPYKSLSISDFWRRWHMTLSAFLRDYLYVALGGNRKGPQRRYVNLLITMVLGGLWHGANWTFVFWGALHGGYLVINHAFRALVSRHLPRLQANSIFRLGAWLLTFLCVVAGWVFFRAADFSSAIRVLDGMFIPVFAAEAAANIHPILWNQGLDVVRALQFLTVLGAIAFLCPNSNLVGEHALHAAGRHSLVPPLLSGISLVACLLLVLVNETRATASAFIYFNF